MIQYSVLEFAVPVNGNKIHAPAMAVRSRLNNTLDLLPENEAQ